MRTVVRGLTSQWGRWGCYCGWGGYGWYCWLWRGDRGLSFRLSRFATLRYRWLAVLWRFGRHSRLGVSGRSYRTGLWRLGHTRFQVSSHPFILWRGHRFEPRHNRVNGRPTRNRLGHLAGRRFCGRKPQSAPLVLFLRRFRRTLRFIALVLKIGHSLHNLWRCRNLMPGRAGRFRGGPHWCVFR
jgi:hypothetical protein